jgi:hypothetical protein
LPEREGRNVKLETTKRRQEFARDEETTWVSGEGKCRKRWSATACCCIRRDSMGHEAVAEEVLSLLRPGGGS